VSSSATADTLVGGSGNNIFKVNHSADVVQAQAGAASNKIITTVSYAAADNAPVLQAAGTANVQLAGNAHGATSLVIGNAGADTLVGGTGFTALEAGAGNTVLSASARAALIGNTGSDSISVGAAPAFVDGRGGLDTINLGSANSVIAFNKGGGTDTLVAGSATGNILSLGGGISESGLTFTKSGNDLVLATGAAGDSVVLHDWYASTANHSVSALQLIEQASSDYKAGSSDVLVNKKIEQFDFNNLVAAFDQARASNPSLTSWNLSNGLLAAHLTSSDTAAYGGDMAYWDGLHGKPSGLDLAAAAAAVQDANFGVAVQIVGSSWAAVSQSSVKLV
jgi:Ca2+-binding RTX toxin-like protein